MDRKMVLLLFAALFTIVSVLDFADAQRKPKKKVIIVPAWRIQLVDEAGNPVKNVFVRQVWKDYDLEDRGHEEDSQSDQNGYVSFPARSEKSVSQLARAEKRLKNMRELGVHASFGVHAYILAWGEITGCKRLEGGADYEAGKPLPTKLQMRVMTLPGFKCEP